MEFQQSAFEFCVAMPDFCSLEPLILLVFRVCALFLKSVAMPPHSLRLRHKKESYMVASYSYDL